MYVSYSVRIHHSDTIGDSLEVFLHWREREREREREHRITHRHLNIYIVIYILKHKVTVEEVERERFEKARLRNVLRLRNLILAESVEIERESELQIFDIET